MLARRVYTLAMVLVRCRHIVHCMRHRLLPSTRLFVHVFVENICLPFFSICVEVRLQLSYQYCKLGGQAMCIIKGCMGLRAMTPRHLTPWSRYVPRAIPTYRTWLGQVVLRVVFTEQNRLLARVVVGISYCGRSVFACSFGRWER